MYNTGSADGSSRPVPELQVIHLTGVYCAGGSANRPRHQVLDAEIDDRLIHGCVAGQGTKMDSLQRNYRLEDGVG
jgi:hypothetical protein